MVMMSPFFAGLHTIRMRVCFCSLMLSLLAVSSALAQTVVARLEPAVAKPNQVAAYIIEVEGGQIDAVPQLRFPLQVSQATALSTRQNLQIRNGVQSVSTVLMWGVVAAEPGEFVIPPQRLMVGGRELVCNEVKFRVDNSASTSQEDEVQPLLQLEVPRREIYQGEVVPLVASLFVPRQVQLRRIGLIEIDKSSVAVARFPQVGEQSATVVDGAAYSVMSFRSTLSSLREGSLKVGPATVELLVDVPVNSTGRPRGNGMPGFFGNFPPGLFSDTMEPRKLSVKSQVINVTVLPLPTEGRPAGFAGAVGDFSMQARVQSNALKVGDPLSVEIEVAGSGNFDALAAPELTEPQGWKLYPAKRYVIEGPTDQNQIPTLERRIGYTQVLVPEAVHRRLPSFEIHFFSPTQKKYVTVRTAPIELQITPPDPTSAAVAATPGSQAAPAAVVAPVAAPSAEITDILMTLPAKARWIKERSGPLLWQQRWFWWLQLLPLSALAMAAVLSGLKRRQARLMQGRAGELRRLVLEARAGMGSDEAEFLRRAAAALHALSVKPPEEPLLRDLLADYEVCCFSPQPAALARRWSADQRREILRRLNALLRGVTSLAVALLLCVAASPSAMGSEESAPGKGSADEVYAQAAELLQKGDYLRAQHAAQSLLKLNPPVLGPQLFELLGHARYKQGDLGRAALWYQRAMLLGPPSPELAQNWRHVRESTRLFVFPQQGILSSISAQLGQGQWWYIAAACWWLACGLAGLLWFGRRTAWLSLVLRLVLLVGLVVGFLAVTRVSAEQTVKDVEVVVGTEVSAYTGASSVAGTVIALPPGTQVRILKTRGSWAFVEIPAEEKPLLGWVSRSELTPLWPYGVQWLPE